MIPKDWSITNLGEVAEVLDPQPDHRTPPEVLNGIPYIGVNDFLPNGEIDVKSCRKVAEEVWLKQQANILVDEGGIIFGKIGTIGMPRMLPTTSIKYALSANVVLIKPKVNRSYILAWLRSEDIHNQIYRTLHTTSQPALGIKKIRELLVNIPPLLEQCKIAEVLGVWDESIDLLEKLIGRVRSRKQGLMQQLLTGKKRFKEFEGSEWKTVRLSEIAKTSSGGTPPSNNLLFYGGDIPWVSISDMTSSGKYLYDTERKLTDLGLQNSSAKIYPIGTILFAMYASIGKCSIAKVFISCSQAILGVQLNEDLVNTEFIYYFLTSQETKYGLMGQHGTQKNLNAGMVRDFNVPLLSLPEQEKIAAVLSAADEEISTLEKQLAAYKQQKLGLMQQLLTGKIRVGMI
jgi:restriction endonuclease S subunit